MTAQTEKGQHTPGPLTVGYYTPTEAFRAIPEHVCAMREDGTPVALCGPSGHTTSEADARLIAAAPELAEMIRYLIGQNQRAYVFSLDTLRKMRELIARVDGTDA